MNLGQAINTILVDSANIKPVLDAGLNREWLEDTAKGSLAVYDGDDRSVARYIFDHYHKYQRVPDQAQVEKAFPGYEWYDGTAKLEEIIDVAIADCQMIMLGTIMDEAADQLQEQKPLAVLDTLSAGVRDVHLSLHTDKELHSVKDIDGEALLNMSLTMGVPLGLEPIDDVFYGWQPEQLITIMGRQKSCKTYLGLLSTMNAHDQGKTSLVFSVEMGKRELDRRYAALGGKANPDRLRKGTWTEAEGQRVLAYLEYMRSCEHEIIISNKTGHLTVDDVAAEIEEREPDFVFVDGFYFMVDRVTGETANDWKANENLAAELKELARRYKVPILTTTQVQEKQYRRGDITADTIQAGTGLLKASDLVLGLNKDFETEVFRMNTVYSREEWPPTVDFQIDWDCMELDIVVEEEIDFDDSPR